ncbi:hypothetical protein DT019_03010 [Streptomyces sp. SDr-06]|uniref:hypothetical protein n=1 Tax=Streptomyces sp. SDr-06 TaxID=2267702 RepID=UPI000DE99FB7|nr:hypothetical protein [Streptomyces sp. SDr-06]RCH70473.1 hypothetical protein DT019_03010 [Streptomyces sp. SDr-06]
MTVTEQPTAAWPEGVIARYVTIAGTVDRRTTVDLTVVEHTHRFPDGIVGTRNSTRAACAGCSAVMEFSHWRKRRGTIADWEVEDRQTADHDADTWAQAHAEKCRRLARPEGN